MRRYSLCIALVIVFASGPRPFASDSGGAGDSLPSVRNAGASDSLPLASDGLPIVVRPGMLAAQIGELAGHTVKVPYARVVGVFNPRAFLIDTATRLPPVTGHRARVLVLVERGALAVAPATIVSSTVTVAGVARTLLGLQVSREVEWPTALSPEAVERLEIRAAILARSVQTAEGVELTIARALSP